MIPPSTAATDIPSAGLSGRSRAQSPTIATSPLLAGYDVSLPGYNELLDEQGNVRAHWQGLIDSMAGLTKYDRRRAIEHSLGLLEENDVSYHPPDAGSSRPWRLDILPFVLAEAEYQSLQLGLAQRTRLLEAIIADCLGPQSLVAEGLLPPGIVFGQDAFFPAVQGTRPSSGRYLYISGYDLARGPDGQWWVLRNRVAMPPGLGYALEARIISSQSLPGIFERADVHRISRFFRTLSESLTALAGGDSALNLVLASRDDSQDFFEHAFLGRYLGQGVVVGEDLTVRDGQVYLKTVRGLQPVDLLLRRIPTARCDPLELDTDSSEGVSGLMQVLRTGHVSMANWPGSEIADSPALASFLPGLCEHLLGEKLRLPSAASWWCGQPKERDYVIDNLHALTIRRMNYGRAASAANRAPNSRLPNSESIVGASLDAAQRAELVELIHQFPAQFVAQEAVTVSYAPAWNQAGELVPAATSVRLYLTAAGKDDFYMLPGGIARSDTYEFNAPQPMRLPNELNKDIWISRSDSGPVDVAASMLNRPVELRRSDINLASRTADNLFWLGSYMERAEGAVRLFRTLLQQVSGERGVGQQVAALDRIAAVLVANRHLSQRRVRRLVAQGKSAFALSLSQMSFDPDTADNLYQILENIARIADSVRERLSTDMWRLLERLTQMPEHWRNDPIQDPRVALENLNAMTDAMAAINGMIALNMTRADGWRFLDMGRRLERTRQTARLFRGLAVRADDTEHGSLNLLLELSDCAITYRSRYPGAAIFVPVTDLVLADDTQPRSILSQSMALQRHLNDLPRTETGAMPGAAQTSLFSLESTLRLLDTQQLDRKRTPAGIRRLVTQLTTRIERDADIVTAELSANYFSHAKSNRVSGQKDTVST